MTSKSGKKEKETVQDKLLTATSMSSPEALNAAVAANTSIFETDPPASSTRSQQKTGTKNQTPPVKSSTTSGAEIIRLMRDKFPNYEATISIIASMPSTVRNNVLDVFAHRLAATTDPSQGARIEGILIGLGLGMAYNMRKEAEEARVREREMMNSFQAGIDSLVQCSKTVEKAVTTLKTNVDNSSQAMSKCTSKLETLISQHSRPNPKNVVIRPSKVTTAAPSFTAKETNKPKKEKSSYPSVPRYLDLPSYEQLKVKLSGDKVIFILSPTTGCITSLCNDDASSKVTNFGSLIEKSKKPDSYTLGEFITKVWTYYSEMGTDDEEEWLAICREFIEKEL